MWLNLIASLAQLEWSFFAFHISLHLIQGGWFLNWRQAKTWSALQWNRQGKIEKTSPAGHHIRQKRKNTNSSFFNEIKFHNLRNTLDLWLIMFRMKDWEIRMSIEKLRGSWSNWRTWQSSVTFSSNYYLFDFTCHFSLIFLQTQYSN